MLIPPIGSRLKSTRLTKVTLKTIPASMFFILIACILLYPQNALSLAYTGLMLWFEKMVPTLLPFMIISSILILLDLDKSVVSVFSFFLRPIFRLSHSCIYAIIIGFFCGFPLGAKTVADLYKAGKINHTEASLIVSFNNNLGPVYFNGFILHSLRIPNKLPFIFGMYGIPLLYGLILRHTQYRKNISYESCIQYAEFNQESNPHFFRKQSLPHILDSAIGSSLLSISKLAGYMVFFNVLNLIPSLLLQNSERAAAIISLILEISSGASRIIHTPGLFSQNVGRLVLFTALSFTGCSCFAQTGSVLSGSGLSLKNYVRNRLLITLLSFAYYVLVIFS